MDQAVYLFDNQYHPEALDKIFHKIASTTWDHCMNVQKQMCQQTLYHGNVQDFKLDEKLNTKMGFPAGSYTTFIPAKLLKGNQKYILDKFIKQRKLITLREILKDVNFESQYIFHFADYVYMYLRCCLTQTGTYLIIPTDTSIGGIDEEFLQFILRDYDNPYAKNTWTLEVRNKVSYAYGEFTTLQILDGNRIYLDQFSEHKEYLKAEMVNDWKVCCSDRSAVLPLMRMTPAVIKYDEADHNRPYLEVTDIFVEYIRGATFNLHCFLFNEAHKVGNAVTPNYIGPTNYLKTVFDEYLATVDSRRLKVVAQDLEGGWTTVDGSDIKFGSDIEDLVAVGFTKDQCWVAIPTKDMVSPIHPSNFRVWEYDPERDTLGRMVSTEMVAKFPNIYLYKMYSDESVLYIEWYRDDVTVDSNYYDFTADYRKYVGNDFFQNILDGNVPDVLKAFEPVKPVFDATEFIKNILLYSAHDYRVEQMVKLLHETGLQYKILYNELDKINCPYTTMELNMADRPELYTSIKAGYPICIGTNKAQLHAYDLYVDGKHIADTEGYIQGFMQYITVPTEDLTETSVLIIDMYEPVEQFSRQLFVDNTYKTALLGYDFPMEKVSGSDLVLASANGDRIDTSKIKYGMYATEWLVQIPEKMVDWDALGITIDDPRLVDRVAINDDGTFKSIVYRYIDTTPYQYQILATKDGEQLRSSQDEILLVKGGDVFATIDTGTMENTSEKFCKRIPSGDMCIMIDGYEGYFTLYTANVKRMGIARNLGEVKTATIISFYGHASADRIVPFINGAIASKDVVTSTVPQKLNSDYVFTFNGDYQAGDRGEVVYLPFCADRFDVTSDANAQLQLAGSGVMTIGEKDLVFEDGLRISNSKLERVTNQIIKVPKANAIYTIIRQHRDSNLFAFNDSDAQSFLDELFTQSPGYKQHVGLK